MTDQWLQLEQLQTKPLQNNMHVLQVIDPVLLQYLQRNLSTEPLLFQQQNGAFCCRSANEPEIWLFGQTSLEQEMQHILQQIQLLDLESSLFVFLGNSIGPAYAAFRPQIIHHLTKQILIIESNASRLWAFLAFVDVSQELIQGRLHLYSGSPDEQTVMNAIHHFGLWNSTKLSIFTAPKTQIAEQNESIINRYFQEKQKHEQFRLNQIHSITRQKVSTIIKRVLLIDCWTGKPGSVHLQSIDKVLQTRGVTTHVLPLNYQCINWHVNEYIRLNDALFLQTLDSFQPDLILSFGYHAPELVRRDVYDASSAVWVQVVTNLGYHPKEYYPNERPVLVEEKLFTTFQKKGVQNPIYLPLVANEIADSPVQSNHNIPVVFVGNSFAMLPGDLKLFMERIAGRNELKRYLQTALHELSIFDKGQNLFDYLQHHPPPQINHEDDEYPVFRFLLSQATANRRRQVLESIVDKGLMLFGGDWDRALPPNSPLRKCFHHYADENIKTQLAENGFIFLNIHSVGNATCPNMRFFNTPGAGNFQMSDQKQFCTFFEFDKETVYYETRQELREKIDYYLHHKQEADEIRLRGYEKVKSCWTYDYWVDALFKKLELQFVDNINE